MLFQVVLFIKFKFFRSIMPHFLRHPFTFCKASHKYTPLMTLTRDKRNVYPIAGIKKIEMTSLDASQWPKLNYSIAFENTSWPVAPSEGATLHLGSTVKC